MIVVVEILGTLFLIGLLLAGVYWCRTNLTIKKGRK